jgi:hypothetical protein
MEIALNGEYWVVYTNDDGCSVTTDRIDSQIIITDVSVKENELPLLVKVYPNPATSTVFVEFDGQLDAILMYGMDGSLIYKPQNIDTGITQMDLDFLPAGTYLLQLLKDDQVVIKKIIKQ